MNASFVSSCDIDVPVAGLVLASGLSRRFPGENKLLLPCGGEPVIARTVRAYVEAGLRPVTVVVGFHSDAVLQVLRHLSTLEVLNADYEQGQSRSLVRGVEALPDSSVAAVIGVGDQPLLSPAILSGLVALYRTSQAPLVVPRYGGRRGNPVLFDRSLFPELLRVTGDTGGRPVLLAHADKIAWLDVPDPLPALDVDTPAQYQQVLAALGAS